MSCLLCFNNFCVEILIDIVGDDSAQTFPIVYAYFVVWSLEYLKLDVSLHRTIMTFRFPLLFAVHFLYYAEMVASTAFIDKRFRKIDWIGDWTKVKMSCLLCFSVKSDEFIIAVDGAESRELEVAAVLHKYFKILFYVSETMTCNELSFNFLLLQVQPQMGYVCRKCWLRVEDFHKFYTKIESLHCPTGDIFSETIFVDKLDVEPDRLAVSVNEDYHSASIPLKKEEDEKQIEEEGEDEAEVDDKLALDEFVLEFSTSQSEPTKAEGNKTSNALNDNLSTNQLRRKTNQWGRRGSEKLRKLRKKM